MLIQQIDHNRGMYGETGGLQSGHTSVRKEKGKGFTETIQASDLNLGQDDITRRKMEAQRNALSVVKKQFKADDKIDEDFKKRRTEMDQLAKASEKMNQEIVEASKRQEQLKEEYGITDDSQEQKDVELLLKFKRISNGTSNESFTNEDFEQLMNMGESTEYRRRFFQEENYKDLVKEDLEAAQKNISIHTQVIKGVKQELLKHHGMVDASNSADKILEAARKEMIGMLMAESKDYIKEKIDEAVEKGKEAKEEKEKLEEIQEAKKQEDESVNKVSDVVVESDINREEIDQKIQEVLDKMKLLEEDLKGISIDKFL